MTLPRNRAALLFIAIVLVVTAVVVSVLVLAYRPERADQNDVIRANVPASADFDRILQRDLNAFFAGHVTYELLRDEPAQAGAAYPRFYLWIAATDAKGRTTSGALRLAAIKRQRFESREFLAEQDIRRDPASLRRIFPPDVCEKIEHKLGLR